MTPVLLLILMALLAVAGWAFSFYFLMVVRGKMAPNVWWMPPVCRMSEGTCNTLVETPYGKIIGKPNAFWGALFYPLILVLLISVAFGKLASASLLILGAFSLTMSFYLVWGLYRLRTPCPVCFATHAINLLFLILAGVYFFAGEAA